MNTDELKKIEEIKNTYTSSEDWNDIELLLKYIVELEKQKNELLYWLGWVLENCDDSLEWNFGTEATQNIRILIDKAKVMSE